jgi:hypothetical protein
VAAIAATAGPRWALIGPGLVIVAGAGTLLLRGNPASFGEKERNRQASDI